MSATFFKEILYVSTTFFFSLCCPRNKTHRSTRRHLTTMMTANVIQTKKEQKITDVNYPYSQVEKLKLPEVNLYS